MYNKKLLITLGIAATASCALSASSMLYLENFSNVGGFTRPATAVGWQGFWQGGTPSAQYNIAELADPGGVQYNSPLSNPSGVNNNPVPGGVNGTAFWSPTFIFNVTIATQEYAGAIQSSQLGSFSWDFSLDAPSSSDGQLLMRALVQVGGNASDTDNWYVSNPLMVVNTADFNNGGPNNGFYVGRWETATVLASSDWILMPSYDYANRTLLWPSSDSAKGESDFAGYGGYTFYNGALPDGIVHGFGIFMDNRAGGNLWIDNYTITAIPEPRLFALSAGLAVFSLVWLRRRKVAHLK